MNLDDIFREEEARLLQKAREDIAREAADPVFQQKSRERMEQFARDLEQAEANVTNDTEDDDEDEEDDD